MKTDLFRINFLLVVCAFLFPPPIHSQQVSIDTTSARAVLKALHNPHLTHEKAMEIAKLTGNQGMISKRSVMAVALDGLSV